jgi:hypothetical protein
LIRVCPFHTEKRTSSAEPALLRMLERLGLTPASLALVAASLRCDHTQ